MFVSALTLFSGFNLSTFNFGELALTVLVFAFVLSSLVFIHELGHYMMARFIGVHVEEFGFGLPPRIFGINWGKTLYSINWLPIGGFVKLAGEDVEDKPSVKITAQNRKTFFWARSKKERAAILLAGVTMNFLLALFLNGVLLVHGVEEPTDTVRVNTVVANSPAALAGIEVGDVVKSVKKVTRTTPPESVTSEPTVEFDKEIKSSKDLIDTAGANKGSELLLTLVHGSQTRTVAVTPRVNPPPGEGYLGLGITNVEIHKYSVAEAPLKSLEVTASQAYMMISSVGEPFLRLITFQNVCGQMAGPIGIARVTGQAIKYGFWTVLSLMSMLSLNLAVLNVLPIPALDGGRLLFVVLEKFIGKKVNPEWERKIHAVGMFVLMGLILLITINDIICPAVG